MHPDAHHSAAPPVGHAMQPSLLLPRRHIIHNFLHAHDMITLQTFVTVSSLKQYANFETFQLIFSLPSCVTKFSDYAHYKANIIKSWPEMSEVCEMSPLTGNKDKAVTEEDVCATQKMMTKRWCCCCYYQCSHCSCCCNSANRCRCSKNTLQLCILLVSTHK